MIDSLEDFLSRNRIERAKWEGAAIEWELLHAIATAHEEQLEHLRTVAELLARIIQTLEPVHSVRWRVKTSDHLLEKIIRKRFDQNEKYLNIERSNYNEVVTDLVGVRALHLFKEQCFPIDALLRSIWEPIEIPIVYIRDGDRDEQFRSAGFDVKRHSAGYRSVHYVIESRPTERIVRAEIQVRTIFEEGWSEIDHKIKYPNYSKSDLVEYFLGIFNRLAGSADEMGSFVQGLSNELSKLDEQLLQANAERDSSLRRVDETPAGT